MLFQILRTLLFFLLCVSVCTAFEPGTNAPHPLEYTYKQAMIYKAMIQYADDWYRKVSNIFNQDLRFVSCAMAGWE